MQDRDNWYSSTMLICTVLMTIVAVSGYSIQHFIDKPSGEAKEVNEVYSNQTNDEVTSADFQSKDGICIEDKPYIYKIMLNQPKIGSPNWESTDSVPVRRFYLAGDKRKWIKVGGGIGEHFHNVFIGIDDPTKPYRGANFIASVKPELRVIQAKHFQVMVTPIEVQTQDDPDPETPIDGKVFKKLVLQVEVREQTKRLQ